MTTTTPGAAPANPSPTTAADVEEALHDVIDPELGENVVDLGFNCVSHHGDSHDVVEEAAYLGLRQFGSR